MRGNWLLQRVSFGMFMGGVVVTLFNVGEMLFAGRDYSPERLVVPVVVMVAGLGLRIWSRTPPKTDGEQPK